MLLHVITLGPVILDISIQEIIATLREKINQLLHPATPDEILERKKAKSVPKVSIQLNEQAASNKKMPDIITIRLIQDRPAPKPKAVIPTAIKKITAQKKPSKPKSDSTPQQSADDLYTELMNQPTVVAKSPQEEVNFDVEEPAPAYDLNHNTLIDNTTVRVVPSESSKTITGTPTAALVATGARKPNQSSAEAAPPFPVEILARYRTSVMGFDFNMYREWHMEGRQYSIVDTTTLLGFKFSAISDGAINEQGLQPKSFQILVNNDINRFATFDRTSMTMSYGKPSKPKKMPFNSTVQDISSIGFQMALVYIDKAQDVQVTAGTGIYTIKMQLVAEEKIRLPVGIVRTLHIHGQTISGDAAADVWLAPDYRNMPVKVKVSSEGRTLDQSLSSLSIEGTVIFGKKYPPQEQTEKQTEANTSNLPEPIKQEVEF
ncbi:MAG: hypothetical protein NVS3B3_03660 [Aquirhabdus sp.]